MQFLFCWFLVILVFQIQISTKWRMCISNSYLFDCICDPNISHSVRIKSNQTILIMHDEQEIFMLQTNTTCIHLFFSPPFPQMTSKIIINNPSRSIPHENIILSEQKKKKEEWNNSDDRAADASRGPISKQILNNHQYGSRGQQNELDVIVKLIRKIMNDFNNSGRATDNGGDVAVIKIPLSFISIHPCVCSFFYIYQGRAAFSGCEGVIIKCFCRVCNISLN